MSRIRESVGLIFGSPAIWYQYVRLADLDAHDSLG